MSLKHSPMTLYSSNVDIDSHRARIILTEKGVLFNVVYIDSSHPLPKNLENSVTIDDLPILVDRDLVLCNTEIIGEYLDERFPHPPLLPVYPAMRAKCRLMIKYFESEIYPVFRKFEELCYKEDTLVAAEFIKYLGNLEEVLGDEAYIMSDIFSLVDCCLVPLLYRLKVYNSKILNKFEKLSLYASRVFCRPNFQSTLSELEKEMSYGDGEFYTI